MRRYSAPPKLPDSCITGPLGIAQNRHVEPVGAVIEPQLLRQNAHAVEDLRFAFLLGKEGKLVNSTLAGGARWFVITPCQYCAVNLFSATSGRCGRRVFRYVQIIEDETGAEAGRAL